MSPSYAWSADESAVYLLWNDVIVGYSCTDGCLFCETPAPSGAKTLLFAADSLCVIDEAGYLTRMQVNGMELIPLRQMILVQATQCSNWTFMQGHDGLDYLLEISPYKDYRNCAVIDTESFEVVYRIGECCGIDVDRALAYRKYYDCFDAYTIPDAAQLKTLASARLG